MAFTINTNISSLQAQNYLRSTQKFQGQTINRVTSGLRIVNSGDDAAGLAIANTYRSNEAVLTQGVRNANDGLSQLQIADGGISNISQLLDRARTLATQSASGAFTGDRSVLSSEFQSVLGEIDRQAQAIGLTQGGQFAKALNVFIGGGQASSSTTSIVNGSIQLDLSQSTVDSQSLGLKGVQAVNTTANSRDLSAGHATSVQAIVQDTNNAQTNNTTTFYFAGPGFSDSNKVAVGVNLTGVTDTTTLVAAVNSAIQNAGNSGASSAATAFKNAGIAATVFTDANGQHLAFNSGTSFQVQAGDVLANALLGNTAAASGSSAPDGLAISTTVTGSANASNAALGAQVTVRIQGGGLTSPVDITLASGKTIADLQTAVAANTTLKAAGITLTTATNGAKLVFTGAKGEQLSVQAAGDTANVFGLGSFRYGASSSVDNTTFAGTYANTTAYGTTNLEFSINGSAATSHVVSVNLNAGNATAGSAVGNKDLTAGVTIGTGGEQLDVTVDGGAVQHIALNVLDTTGAKLVNDINSTLTGATASLAVGAGGKTYLQITSTSFGAHSSVAIANGTATALADTTGAATPTAGTSRDGDSLAAAINQAIGTDATLQAAGLNASNSSGTITIASNNNTNFQLNAYSTNGDVGFGTAGATFSGGNVAANSAFVAYEAGGAYQTSALGFSGISHGNDSQTITITANDAAGAQQSQSVVLQNNTTRNARTLDEAINTINTTLQKSNIAVLQGVTAVKDQTSGTEQIRFISTKAFNVSIGTDANGTGIGSPGTNQKASSPVGTGATADISNQTTAQAAVNGLADAVSKLGSAQAVVGRGENQFNYAINLANSQLTNFAAAESQIRDADLASESANLTKSQILLQAGIAALAQANSAPQQVLTLLRG